MPYDTLNPYMGVRLVRPDGSYIPLWTSSEFGKSCPFVTDVEVELKFQWVPNITVTLTGSYEDLLPWVSTDDFIVWGRTQVEVQFGYVSGTTVLGSPVHSGLVTKPDVTLGTEVSMVLRGIGGLGWYATRAPRAMPSEKMTRYQLMLWFLSGQAGAPPRVFALNDLAVRKLGGGNVAYQRLFVDEVAAVPGFMSDWHQFIQLCRDAQCWAVTVGNNINLIPLTTQFTDTPKYLLSFMGAQAADGMNRFDLSAGAYPIVSFNSPTTAVYMPGALEVATMQYLRSGDGSAVREKYGLKDTKGGQPPNTSGPGGSGQLEEQEPNDETGDGHMAYVADQPVDEVVHRVQGEMVGSLADKMGVRVEIETILIPDMLPGHTFRLLGIGPRFDYNYTVHEVVHSVGSGGGLTKLVGYSNSSYVVEQVKKSLGVVDNPPPTGDTTLTSWPTRQYY